MLGVRQEFYHQKYEVRAMHKRRWEPVDGTDYLTIHDFHLLHTTVVDIPGFRTQTWCLEDHVDALTFVALCPSFGPSMTRRTKGFSSTGGPILQRARRKSLRRSPRQAFQTDFGHEQCSGEPRQLDCWRCAWLHVGASASQPPEDLRSSPTACSLH